MDLSIIVPALREPYLNRTVDSILKNSELKNIEVLVGVYHSELSDKIKNDPRVRVFEQSSTLGMRGTENIALDMARGKYIMKADAHCIFAPGFDKVMIEDCAEDWLMIPKRYSIDFITWDIKKNWPVVEYEYLAFPVPDSWGYTLRGAPWHERKAERADAKYDIDDLMIFQGSCWLANRKYFMNRVGYLDDRKETYGSFAMEQVEVGLKYWLGGGKIKLNKNTWYAHLHKTKNHYKSRLFSHRYKKFPGMDKMYTWTSKHWINNEEPNMIYKFKWLIDKFWPVPKWPENWQEVWKSYNL